MKKIYIAGKVTGEPIAECTMKFGVAQKKIEAIGFEAINPLAVVGDFNASWEVAMKKCLKALIDCDGVILLPCWQGSRGATIEWQLAKDLGLVICNASDFGFNVLKKNLTQ